MMRFVIVMLISVMLHRMALHYKEFALPTYHIKVSLRWLRQVLCLEKRRMMLGEDMLGEAQTGSKQINTWRSGSEVDCSPHAVHD